MISCDNLITIPAATLEAEPVGHLELQDRIRHDEALRYAFDIQY